MWFCPLFNYIEITLKWKKNEREIEIDFGLQVQHYVLPAFKHGFFLMAQATQMSVAEVFRNPNLCISD